MNRRDFLHFAGAGAVVVAIPVWLEYLDRLFWRRRVWPVGASFGLVPIAGSPGEFYARHDFLGHLSSAGKPLVVMDFRESHRWETVVFPQRGGSTTMNVYFQDVATGKLLGKEG